MDKVEFIHFSEGFGELVMKAKTWSEAAYELRNDGWANSGKCKVVKRTYKWVSDEPQIIDTDWR